MKLKDIMTEQENKGTYAGVCFDETTKNAIVEYTEKNKIPNALKKDSLHTTLLYSRKYLPNYKPQGKIIPPYEGTPVNLEIWPTQSNGNALVLKYSCPALENRHKQLMKEHNATFDYDSYNPHVTLSYDVGELTIDSLKDFRNYIKNISIIEEYSEPLDLDWAGKSK